MSLANLCTKYRNTYLSKTNTATDPIIQFIIWFSEAFSAKIHTPNAMSVSTVDLYGKPSSRTVLLKQVNINGFMWFSNYHSQKGQEIKLQPYVALLFYWAELERQVRIEGKITRITAHESDIYFTNRPLFHQFSAIASQQSKPINNRKTLEKKFYTVQKNYHRTLTKLHRPNYWGGYQVFHNKIEFWQGRASRLHDRIIYTRTCNNIWKKQRLQP